MKRSFFEKAKWTEYNRFETPLVIKNFIARKGKAVLAICGLGWFEAYLNGIRIGGDCFFLPAQSDYSPRDLKALIYPVKEKLSHRIYYNVFDVTDMMKDGKNELRILLGNGWYRQRIRHCEGNTSYANSLKLIFELSFSDGGKIFSDSSLVYTDSHIRRSDLYIGEIQDMSFCSAEQVLAEEIPPPEARFCRQTCPPDKIYEKLRCKPLGNGIFDAGINGAGRLKIIASQDSERIIARYAEELYADGTLDFSTSCLGSMQIQKDEWLNVKKGQILTTSFVWHGFRYISIEGTDAASEVTVEHIGTYLPIIGKYSCDVPALNWLYETAVNTIRSNFHGGVPSDCPHRERLGYTGDGQLVAETALLLFECENIYKKWLTDILDGQESDGHIQHTAPFEGGGGGPVGWGGAVILLPYKLYSVTGKITAVKSSFLKMEKWCRFIEASLMDGLVVREREGGWCLGEWCTPEELTLAPSFVNTCLFIRCLDILEELCAVVKKTFAFSKLRSRCKRAVKQRFYDKKTGDFAGGAQGANLFAFAAGLGGERAKKRTEKYYMNHSVDTGIFGTELLFDFLAARDRGDIIYKLFTDKEYPSYGYMRVCGATTFWETWRGDKAVSHNHPMFASPVKHLFFTALGIKIFTKEKKIIIEPRYIGMNFVEGETRILGSRIKVRLCFSAGKLSECSIVLRDRRGQVNVYINNEKKIYPIEREFFWPEKRR